MKIVKGLDVNWKMIMLLCNIERFDVMWPQLIIKERCFLQALKSDATSFPEIQDFIASLLSELSGEKIVYAFTYLERLTLWYETEFEIHPLVKCIVFSYRVNSLLKSCGQKDFSIQIGILVMNNAGYKWAKYLNIEDICLGDTVLLNDFLLNFLSKIRHAQHLLIRMIDRYGCQQGLDSFHKLLLFVIEKHEGITTNRIAVKIGKSKTTVRRMLNKLKDMQLIDAYGSGPKLSYKLTLNCD